MRSRNGPGELVEAGRHVVRLADEDDLVAPVRLGLDERGDGAQRGREERAVGREAIGGSHAVSVLYFDAPAPKHRLRDLTPDRLEGRHPRNRKPISRNKIQAGRDKNQIKRNKISRKQ